MALVNCKECNKEVSKDAKVCPHCGVKKPYKAKRTWKEYAIALIIGLIVVGIFGESESDKAIKLEKEIVQLEEEIKDIPFEKIEKNRNGYKKLSEYYPENKIYKEKYNFYENKYKFMANCQYMAHEKNKASLNHPSTYEENWDNLNTRWNNQSQYEFQSSFSGKNSFGVVDKFVARYVCEDNNGNTNIKRLFIKKY